MQQDEIRRSRYVRRTVLDVLWTADGAGNGFGFTFDQFKMSFYRSELDVADSELRRELNDLVEGQLIRRDWDTDLNANVYTLMARGRDFRRAECPWNRLNEFTGSQP